MNPTRHILIFAVRLYRWTLSPAKTFLSGPLGQCRFEPSCSVYAIEALLKHGAARGSWLAARRVCRCHPWGDCGFDPVPEGRARRSARAANANRQPHLKNSPDDLKHPTPTRWDSAPHLSNT